LVLFVDQKSSFYLDIILIKKSIFYKKYIVLLLFFYYIIILNIMTSSIKKYSYIKHQLERNNNQHIYQHVTNINTNTSNDYPLYSNYSFYNHYYPQKNPFRAEEYINLIHNKKKVFNSNNNGLNYNFCDKKFKIYGKDMNFSDINYLDTPIYKKDLNPDSHLLYKQFLHQNNNKSKRLLKGVIQDYRILFQDE
tara:strand:+ start:431 stop:1009 length:579 start_codon:yes stop_codon:yes gene_type:complete